MLEELIKVAYKLNCIGLTKEAGQLSLIISKLASGEDERAEFAEMQREMRERNSRREDVARGPTEAEQIANDAKRWKEQQAMDDEDPEVKIIEEAASAARAFAKTKNLLFQAKRQQNKTDTERLELSLARHDDAISSILERARKIDSEKTGRDKFDRECWRNVSRVIYEIKTAPITHSRSKFEPISSDAQPSLPKFMPHNYGSGTGDISRTVRISRPSDSDIFDRVTKDRLSLPSLPKLTPQRK